MTLAIAFLIVLAVVVMVQYFSSRAWESLLFEQSPGQTRQAMLRIGLLGGGVGITVLEVFAFWSVDPSLVSWLLQGGRIVVYAAASAAWVMWCANSIAYRLHDPFTWVFNIGATAAFLTLDFPVLYYLKNGTLPLLSEHLMQFVVNLLLVSTIVRMAMTVLGFTRIRQGLELNLFGVRWLSPSRVFMLSCVMVNMGILAGFWSLWPSYIANATDGLSSTGQTGLGQWLSTQGNLLIGLSLVFATLITLWGSSYTRRVYAALEDSYLWAGKDTDVPRSMRGLLSNTKLIRSTLDMTRIGVVFWKSPGYHLGVGYTDLRSGYTYISAGFIHDEGLSRVPKYSNLPDFWNASIHPDDLGGFAALQVALKDPSRNHFAHIVRFAGADGQWMFIKGEAIVERDAAGLPLAFYGIHTDVTQQVSDNRKLLASNERKLHAMRTLGHDMQSNLSTLSMSLDLLQRRLEKGDTTTFAQAIGRMRTAVGGAIDLLSDTVAIAKSEDLNAPVKLTDVRMRPFVEDIVATQIERYRVSDSKIGIQCEPQMMLRNVDSFALSSLLGNLVSNAIKYTPAADGRVNVTVHAVPGADGQMQARVEVADEGIGIPPDFEKNLFQAFRRADNVGAIPGTGLGMTLVRTSLESLKADLSFETMPKREKGTCFTVDLPNRFERMLPRDLEQAA